MTSSTPLARARMRASGVIGQLKRLLADKAGIDLAGGAPVEASPALAEALSRHATQVQTQVQTQQAEAGSTVGEVVVYDDAAVERAAVELRVRTTGLKKKAASWLRISALISCIARSRASFWLEMVANSDCDTAKLVDETEDPWNRLRPALLRRTNWATTE